MGNTFTIYTGNNQFNINAVTEIYAIAIVGLSSEITYGQSTPNADSGGGEGTAKHNMFSPLPECEFLPNIRASSVFHIFP